MESSELQDLAFKLKRFSGANANVLLLGGNGEQRQILARLVHAMSRRSEEVFETLDVVAYHEFIDSHYNAPDTIVPVSLRNVHRGTLFVDDVEGLSLVVQAHLYWMDEAGKVETTSGLEDFDYRIISGTPGRIPHGENIDERFMSLITTYPLWIPESLTTQDGFERFSAYLTGETMMPPTKEVPRN